MSERQLEGCCERYGANDDVVGRWLAAAVNKHQIFVISPAVKRFAFDCSLYKDDITQ